MAKFSETKVALITGAARRIGASIARECHAAGMNIIIHYNNSKSEAEALCDELNSIRENSTHAIQADLSEIDKIQNFVDHVIESWGFLDVLVNNASQFIPTPIKDVTTQQWNDLLNCNLQAPFFLAKQCYSHLSKRKGCIINITDIHGSKPLKNYSIYSISKAGLIMMTKSLAKEFAPDVRVNAVSPGAIMWPEQENELTIHQKEKIIQQTLLKRHGNPHDIAQAVLFFISNEYVTGQVLAVDGGRSVD